MPGMLLRLMVNSKFMTSLGLPGLMMNQAEYYMSQSEEYMYYAEDYSNTARRYADDAYYYSN
jgi:hypothetical protein